jgi:hypothetical protein
VGGKHEDDEPDADLWARVGHSATWMVREKACVARPVKRFVCYRKK